ncbi:uncharacterized protein LOC130724973 [Lotus japonicus]|uniref:uncharacterized protein LOC130724973 n=1 Tax=Lotus japonicus TaxID=34305 RepID=UPI002584B54B|nr:uncharacterized protein LOC130724973 [Lotus japonicus]
MGLLKGYKVGKDEVEITHLQFADDTLIIGNMSAANTWTTKGILRWFELVSGLKVIEGIQLLRGNCDRWLWSQEASGEYTVKSTYRLIWAAGNSEVEGEGTEDDNRYFKGIWCNLVPSKVAALAWKIGLQRLPTMDNLMKRGCNKWLGIDSTVLPQNEMCHFLQHVQGRQGKRIDELWKVTWFATIWSIWLLRNSILFRGGDIDLLSVMELIKMRSWWWLKARAKNFKASFYEWNVDPGYCLRMCS